MFYASNFIIIFVILQTQLTNSFKCETDGFFPDERECWIYHICVGAIHSIKTCQDDLLFNPKTKECDWAMNVNCSSTPPSGSRPTHVLQLSESNLSSPFDYLCQLIDNDYVAHPTDCKRYAYCANGVAQPKICKKTLLWSQAEKMCVWPIQSDCPMKYPTTITTTTTTTTTTNTVPITTSPIDTTIYPMSYLRTDSPPIVLLGATSSSICPPSKSWRVPDPYDCAIYHDCYEGADLISYCPAQLQYNPEKRTCDLPENVQCQNKCTNRNEGARFLDSASCCHFYECITGKLILQTCPQPTLFDLQTRKCLPYKKVNCDGRRQCLNKCHYLSHHGAIKGSCDNGLSCIGYSDGFYLDRTKSNCQSYFQCLDHRVVNHSRCSSGQRFNRNIGRCISADQVPCVALKLNETLWLILTLFILVNEHSTNDFLYELLILLK